jgi:hypothetical protein
MLIARIIRQGSCFLALLLAAGSLQASVTLYRDAGFRGESETFRGDVADLRRSRVGNDTASSVRVRPGCVVTLYADPNFRGTYTELDRDEPSLENAAVGNDRVSSLRVDCRGGGWQGPDTRSGVMLYQNEGFRGDEEWFSDDVPDLGRTRVGNDAASSLRATRGCRVRLYDHVGYGGRYAELGGDVWRLSETRIGNDRASSIQVRCSGDRRPWGRTRPGEPGWGGGRPPAPGVTLFRDAGYRGASQTFDGSVADLRGSTIGNDEASSVRVPRGCRVLLFRDAGYRGVAIELRDDIADLGRTRVGNDTVSSLRVDCW